MPKSLFNVVGRVVAAWESRGVQQVAIQIPRTEVKAFAAHGIKFNDPSNPKLTVPHVEGLDVGSIAKVDLHALEKGKTALTATPHVRGQALPHAGYAESSHGNVTMSGGAVVVVDPEVTSGAAYRVKPKY